MVEEACTDIQEKLKRILKIKQDGGGAEELKPLLRDAALELVRLKMAAHAKVDEYEQQKEATAKSKALADESNLRLQNLLYEKNYYNKEIAACLAFKSKYTEEEIGLVDEATFLKEAPPQFLEGIDDPHQLQMQRLNYEKYQRQEMLKKLEGLKQQKEEKELALAEKQKFLDDIQAQLALVRQSAEPLRKLLDIETHDWARHQRQAAAAALLPVPLFIIFHQLTAAASVFEERLEITIAGLDKSVAALWPEGGEPAEKVAPSSKRAKKEEQQSSSSEQNPAVHPLSVVLHLEDVEGSTFVLHFHYLPGLELVTVRTADALAQQVLSSLFPGDKGEEVPSESALFKALSSKADFGPSRADKPYMWAQHLGGMDFLPALTPGGSLEDLTATATVADGLQGYRQERRVQEVLKRIRMVAARAAVDATLEAPLGKATQGFPPSVRRMKTWEEIVTKRPLTATPTLSVAHSPDAVATAEVDAATPMEEDGLAPEEEEEGELPDA